MIHFTVDQHLLTPRQRVSEGSLARIGRRTARWCRVSDPSWADIAFISESQMKQLNRNYHGGRGVTDVLSFEATPPSPKGYLGEIFLYYPRAVAQAKTAKHAVHYEVEILIAHGLLHLLGYDHDTLEKQEEMFTLQERVCAP